jgi:alpha-L-rhamnosidase
MTDTQVLAPRAEHHQQALGIGIRTPRLSWQMRTTVREWRQQAYEIEALSPDGTRLWGTGRVESADSVLVAWPGPALVSRERVRARIRVWGRDDADPTDWSSATVIEAALLDEGDWTANFVGGPADRTAPVQLRRTFTVRDNLVRARAYATACGVYELQLNDHRIGDEVLAPGWTSYHHRLTYQTYDVTDQLQAGQNTVGAWLADGWWRGSYGWNRVGERYGDRTALLVQLELSYADGSVEVVGTDDSWTWSTGEILRSGIYDGEHHDARLRERTWRPVERLEPPVGPLVAASGPPVHRIEELAPLDITRVDPDTHLLDFGQNLAGRLRITVSGPPRRGSRERPAVPAAPAHRRGTRLLRAGRNRRRDMGTTVHLPRLPVR